MGHNAPTFTLPSSTSEPISRADYAGSRVVLSAYPAATTPGCTTQASDFRDNVMFPLLADPDHTVLTAYGAWKDKKPYGKTVAGVIRYNVKATGHVAKLMRELDMTTASG